MNKKVYTLKRNSDEKLWNLQSMLLRELRDSGNIICNQIEQNGNMEILLLVCEKYYYRSNGMISLTIQCFSDHKEQRVTVVSSGGGRMILGTMSATASCAEKVKDILMKHGFAEC